MDKRQEMVVRTVKEIIIKFIETNRVSPQNFDEIFRQVYSTVSETVTTDDGPAD